MRKDLVSLIVKKLSEESEDYQLSFEKSAHEVGVRYLAIDNLLPEDICYEIFSKFPSLDEMRHMSSFREKKFTSKNFDQHDPILSDITFALQDDEVIDQIGNITKIKNQTADPTLYAGGLSAMTKDNFLSPHIDNSHNSNKDKYRTLNLLYYVTPEWKFENGGNLQLWDLNVKTNTTIHSKFNRLVLMETTPTSWHGVNKVKVDSSRFCVSNYYFSSNSPTGNEYFNVTSFSAPMDQLLRRYTGKFDSFLRNGLRSIFPSGLGKEDIYKSKD
jgi:Rps23 Pro-64 3,4-dihydroxylase Tpa1-like proline 4-hydroxylase